MYVVKYKDLYASQNFILHLEDGWQFAKQSEKHVSNAGC
jgi:hypothetical protein